MREIIEALSKPFPPEAIKSRKGRGGKMLDYIGGHDVIGRLNEVFPAWDFEVLEIEKIETGHQDGSAIGKPEVLMFGKLTIDGVTHKQYGSHVHEGEWGDTYKAAMTDTLKKCASLFGVALDLYTDTEPDKPAEAKTGNGSGNVPDAAQSSSRGDKTALASAKQKGMLFAKHKDVENDYPNLSATLKYYASKDTPTTFGDVDAMVKAYDTVKASGNDITRVPEGAVPAPPESGSINDNAATEPEQLEHEAMMESKHGDWGDR